MWAVVLSGMLRKVDIVNLNNYEDWQLKSFNTLDDAEGNRVWYIDREDAVDFVIKNFDKSMIEPSIVLESDLNKNGCRFIYGTKRG